MAKNVYPGINPHLNSFLQHKTGWKGFNNKFLTHLSEKLDAILPAEYYTSTEESMQIGVYDPDTGSPLQRPVQTEPDVLIRNTGSRARSPASEAVQILETDASTLVINLNEIREKEDTLLSLVIYLVEEGDFPGKPVTRIELLSPANKYPGTHHRSYMAKRLQTLTGGLRLVEIDFLHERSPLLAMLPDYTQVHKGAYPYHLIISDPRPSYDEGKARILRFGVLQKIPVVKIPLAANDTISVDLNAIYNQTYANSSLFQRLGSHVSEPVNFEAYSPADRERIKAFVKTLIPTS